MTGKRGISLRVLLAVLFAIALSLTAVACGGGDSSTSAGTEAEATTSEAANSEPASAEEGTGAESESASAKVREPIPIPSMSEAEKVVTELPSLQGKKVAFLSAISIPYLAEDYEGAGEAVKVLGGSYHVFDAEGDPNKELANVRTAINQGYDAILGYSTSQAAALKIAQLTSEANIPFIQFYAYTKTLSAAQKESIPVWIGSDPYDIGVISGEQFVENLEPGDEIAIIRGFSGTAEVTEYEAGFKSIVEPYGLKIVDAVSADWERQKAFAAAQDLLSRYPNLKGMYCMNDDQTEGCVAALRAKGKQPGEVVLSALNVSPEGIKMMEEGWMVGGASMSPSLEGGMAVRIASQLIAGQSPKLLPIHRCWYQNQSVTLENVKELDPASQWGADEEHAVRGLATPCLGQKSALAK